jgi:hypothetical protein
MPDADLATADLAIAEPATIGDTSEAVSAAAVTATARDTRGGPACCALPVDEDVTLSDKLTHGK